MPGAAPTSMDPDSVPRTLDHRVADAAARLATALPSSSAPRVVVSPYRICPIGAHVDHQGGPVLGTAIDTETLLAFAPSGSAVSSIESANFEGRYDLEPGAASQTTSPEGWARYFWAAASAFRAAHPEATLGIRARVEGALPGGGLSSSASVVLAYLAALATVNRVSLSPTDQVLLARRAENEFVGVKCGILDPACIVASKRDHLVAIDTQQPRFEPVAPPASARPSVFLVAFSGADRNLRHTGFNDRVAQCHDAARKLGELSGHPNAEKLGDLDDAVFEHHLDALEDTPRKRARHFFEERRRVLQGIDAWRRGDLETFGALMTDSCRSSIENFEVGSPEIVDLHDVISRTPGVLGARFSGAGFGGCVVALVAASEAEACRATIEEAYRASAPNRTNARVFLAHSRDGLHVR